MTKRGKEDYFGLKLLEPCWKLYNFYYYVLRHENKWEVRKLRL